MYPMAHNLWAKPLGLTTQAQLWGPRPQPRQFAASSLQHGLQPFSCLLHPSWPACGAALCVPLKSEVPKVLSLAPHPWGALIQSLVSVTMHRNQNLSLQSVHGLVSPTGPSSAPQVPHGQHAVPTDHWCLCCRPLPASPVSQHLWCLTPGLVWVGCSLGNHKIS